MGTRNMDKHTTIPGLMMEEPRAPRGYAYLGGRYHRVTDISTITAEGVIVFIRVDGLMWKVPEMSMAQVLEAISNAQEDND